MRAVCHCAAHEPGALSPHLAEEVTSMPWWVWLLVAWSAMAAVAALWLGGAARLIKREERLDLERTTAWDPNDVDHRAAG